MSKIYTGPGRFIKKCSCGAYIHAKCGVCPVCNVELVAGASAKIAAKSSATASVYTEVGRGRKTCPSCGKIVGAKTKLCLCGLNFAQAKAAEPEKVKDKFRVEAEEFMLAQGLAGMKIMYVNADETMPCDISFREFDETSVADWCEDVSTYFYGKGYFASPYLIRWNARKMCPAEQIKNVLVFVKKWQDSYSTSMQEVEVEV